MSGDGRTQFGDAHGQAAPSHTPQPTSPRLPLHRLPEPSASVHAAEAPTVRLAIRTPADDAGVNVPVLDFERALTVGVLKDRLVEEGLGVREGMRIVYGGRFLDDHLVIGQVFTRPKEIQTVHLVARLTAGTSDSSPAPTAGPSSGPTAASSPAATTRPTPTTSSTAPPAALTSARATVQASQDAQHYIYFLIRRDLCALLDVPALQWDDVEPKPVVSELEAQRSLAACLRAWQIEVPWDFNGRDVDVEEMQRKWKNVVGTELLETDVNQALLDLDGFKYKLVLPPLLEMTPDQTRSLAAYLHLQSLVPQLEKVNETFTALLRTITTAITDPYGPPAAAGPAAAAAAAARPPLRPISPISTLLIAMILIPVRVLPLIPLVPVLTFSALKLSAMIWMLTRGMAWTDQNFLMMAGAAFGYWCYEAWLSWQTMRRVRDRVRAERAGPAPVRDAAAPAGGDAATPPTQPGPEVTVMELFNRRRVDLLRPRSIAERVTLIHLDTDNGVLNLRHRAVRPENSRPTSRDLLLATMFPASGAHRSVHGQRLSWLRTHLLLPLVLWFVTLVPDWEVARRREIRRRENEVRESSAVMVEAAERDLAQIKKHRELAEQGKIPREQVENEERSLRESGMDTETGYGEWSRPIKLEGDDKQYAIPTHLSPQAERYWRRVLAQTQGIDWEEEREAQERMGAGEERALL